MKSRERDSVNRTALPLLLLIILVGSLLRVPSLGHESLWNDELASWLRSNSPDVGTMLELIRGNVQSPGYEMLLFVVQKYLGDSEFALRFPSAVAGVLAIPMIYLLAAKLYTNREGLIAAALMAVGWCPIYYSQEARCYSFLLLLSILTFHLWISMMRAFQKGDSPSYNTMVLYLVAATACAYLHYFGTYLVVLQGLAAGIIFAKKGRALVKITIIYLALALLYLPWLPMMLEDLGKKKFWIKPPEVFSFVSYPRFIFNRSTLLLAVAMGLYVYLLIRSLKVEEGSNLRIDPLSPGVLLALWLIIPFLGAFTKSIISTSVLIFRNLIISLPPAYLLLSRAITQLPFKARIQMAVVLILMGLFLGDLIFVKHYYSLPHKEQFREAVQYIVERDVLYENSLIIGCAQRKDFFNYYFSKKGSPARVDLGACRKDRVTKKIIRLVNSEDPSYIWLIWAHKSPDPELRDFLTQNFILLKRKRFIGVAVWLFEVISP